MSAEQISCVRRIQFCAGHRVMGHENKCAHLHGHNYVVFVEARASALDAVGRVVDFSVIKERVGGWIDSEWDHGFLLAEEDKHGRNALWHFTDPDVRQRLFLMPSNPTAENMAAFLLDKAGELLADTGVAVTRVRVWETENCYADAEVPR